MIDRLFPPVAFGETSKRSITVYCSLKFKVDINIDDPQRHDTSRKKLDFKPDYPSSRSNKAQWGNDNASLRSRRLVREGEERSSLRKRLPKWLYD